MASQFEAFATRLRDALDASGFERGRGRTSKLAARYNVSRETARKWLGGQSLPEMERMIALATQTSVNFEWLATGRGLMRDANLGVREESPPYPPNYDLRIMGLVRRMPLIKQRALLELLDNGVTGGT